MYLSTQAGLDTDKNPMPLLDIDKITNGLSRAWADFVVDRDRHLRAGMLSGDDAVGGTTRHPISVRERQNPPLAKGEHGHL
jgi:hypothetical protein